MNITYTQNGDYLIPNIIIRKTKPLGHYGRCLLYTSHGNGQLVEVLVLVNQSDKTISVLFVLLIALDSLFQSRDFGGKLGLFLFVLSVQSGVSLCDQPPGSEDQPRLSGRRFLLHTLGVRNRVRL